MSRVFIPLAIYLMPLIVEATPPPLDCVGAAPPSYEMAYPAFPNGYFTWLLVTFALYLTINSHKAVSREAEEKQIVISRFSMGLISSLGLLLTSAGLCLSLVMTFSAFFRNNCVFCLKNRPDISLMSELGIVGLTILLVLGLKWFIKLIPHPLLRHSSHMLLIICTWIFWLVVLLSSNALYLKSYCL